MPIQGNGLAGHDIVIYQSTVAPRHREKSAWSRLPTPAWRSRSIAA